MKTGGTLSIWLCVGISLLVNGVLIFGAGVYELLHPPAQQVVLYHLHANIWWGATLAVIGLIYCIYYAPGTVRS
jgi:hypothetical protein